MASWPLVGCYGPQLFHTDAAWRGCWKGAAPLEAGLQRRACFCLEHWLKQEKGIILSFWRADITFFVLKLDFFEKNKKLIPANMIPEGRREWCCKNHLFYENDYFIPMLTFSGNVANRMFFGGLCFLFPFLEVCFSQLFSALGPKGLLTFS